MYKSRSCWNVHVFDALKTLRVYVPTLVSKGVIAIFQYVLPWLSIISRHPLTHTSPRIDLFLLQADTREYAPTLTCWWNACARIRAPTPTVRPRLSYFWKMCPFSRRGHQKTRTKPCSNLALVEACIVLMHWKQSGSIFRPWSAKKKVYPSNRKSHQKSLYLAILALITLSRISIFVMIS